MLLLLACLTIADVKNAECRTGCRYHGHDSGYFQTGACHCTDRLEYEIAVKQKRLKMPRKIEAPEQPDKEEGWKF